MGGENKIPNYTNTQSGSLGVYGTLGTFDAANSPGSRDGAARWRDARGNLWMFGGDGYGASSGPINYLHDLWEYDPALRQWAWMGGSSSNIDGTFGVYGTLGVPSADNLPGARAEALSWIDLSGNFWLFGGYGYAGTGAGVLNDLWKYSPSTQEWTWMGGSNTATNSGLGGIAGVYGTKGQASSSSYPGSRDYAASWTDADGNLWLFGGYGWDSNGTDGELNDLWKYDPVANQWTWVSGSSAVPAEGHGQPGVYGTRGTPASANVPGGREIGAQWTDKAGNLWLFGGSGPDVTGTNTILNDLWKFDVASGEWAWMAGDAISPGYGTYGSIGVPSASNTPGGRMYSNNWVDDDGNLWLFGGNGFAADGYGGLLNDLWEYLPASGEWAWMGGNSAGSAVGGPGVYGTLGVAAATNLPGTRMSATEWDDGHGVFWLFGGSGFDSADHQGILNDMWGYVPGNPPLPSPAFSLDSGTYNLGQAITLSDSDTGASIYYTTDGKTIPSVNSTLYSGAIALTGSETIQAIAAKAGSPNSYIASAVYTVLAATPTFSVPAGTYTSAQSVTLSDATTGAAIYYTTDGSTPTTNSSLYQDAITVSKSETISAIAVASGFGSSNVASAAYTINLPPPDFSVAASPASITVNRGQAGTTSITITPSNGFNAAVSFACSGLPAGATCSFSPKTVTPSTSPISTTVTISTSAAAAVHASNRLPAYSPIVFSLVFGSFLWRRKKLRRLLVLVLAAIAVGTLGLGGCSGGSAGGSSGGSQPVTSNVTVTASSGSLQHSTALSVTEE
jgi:N-acetylneuraminic acid mutarotase